jgi:hypothetical protein
MISFSIRILRSCNLSGLFHRIHIHTYPPQRLHAKFSAWLQNPPIFVASGSSEPHDLQIVSVIQISIIQ